MQKIRLSRVGKKNHPLYRIVVLESKEKNQGKITEVLGYFQQSAKSKLLKIDKARFNFWLSKGVLPSLKIKKIIAEYDKAS